MNIATQILLKLTSTVAPGPQTPPLCPYDQSFSMPDGPATNLMQNLHQLSIIRTTVKGTKGEKLYHMFWHQRKSETENCANLWVLPNRGFSSKFEGHFVPSSCASTRQTSDMPVNFVTWTLTDPIQDAAQFSSAPLSGIFPNEPDEALKRAIKITWLPFRS